MGGRHGRTGCGGKADPLDVVVSMKAQPEVAKTTLVA